MFRRKESAPPHETAGQLARRTKKPSALWTDSLGRASVRSGQALLVLTLALAIIYSTIQLKLVVIPVLIALILASALRPLVRALDRRMPSGLAALLALLLGVVVFGGIITIAVLAVQSQFDELQTSVSEGIDEIVRFVQEGGLPVDEQQIEDARQSVIDFVTSSQFGSGALAGVTAAITVITGFVLGIFILFYFLKDGPRIWAFLIKPLHPVAHAKARRAGVRAVTALGGYVRGTAIVALVDAVLIGGALFFLQVPLALPLAIITFIGAFIPIIGATAAGILAALVALVTNDVQTALIVVIVVVAVNQLEGNLLAPLLLGKSLKLHELVVLLALTAGTILGGIIGTLLAVPIAAVAWTIIKSWSEPVTPVPGIDTSQEARDKEVERHS